MFLLLQIQWYRRNYIINVWQYILKLLHLNGLEGQPQNKLFGLKGEGVQDARVACVGAALPVQSSGLGNGSQNVIPQLADREN